MTTPAPSRSRPLSVAIILRVMDRAHEVRVSLPSLLGQEYPDYQVIVVDHSSADGLAAVLEPITSPRLHILRCARPSFFNPSSAGNIGVRYSFSDLVFFLDTGMTFRDEHHLSEIVAAFENSPEIDDRHYERWRAGAGYPELLRAARLDERPGRRVYCECECHGLHTLVDRRILQHIGGLNEALLDWGYEDTDLTTRLELCGYGRIPICDLGESKHGDELRVRFFEVKSKERSWTKNRIISDGFIAAFGPIMRTQPFPGRCDWIEINGIRYRGDDAPQQDWMMTTAADLPRGSATVVPVDIVQSQLPLVSVVVPTKNAAEYLVGALESILSQDYPHIECVVADGGSTDATLDILASYGDRIAWTSEPDRGAFDAINRGWQASRGQILAWLNADDRWAPGAVSAAVRHFQDDPHADVIYGDCLIIDREGRELERRRPPDWDLAYAVESCHHMIDQPAAFVRRAMAERVGWLYPAWFHDWDLWRRISLAGGRIMRVPDLLGICRVRPENSQYNPSLLIEGLVGLTRRFFARPDLPDEVRALRRRAFSNCYVKIVETLRHGEPRGRARRLSLCLQAFAADPRNLPSILNLKVDVRRSPPASREQARAVDAAGPLAPAAEVTAVPPSQDSSERGVAKARRRGPLVSVVVPCKNDARYLPAALESILSQDYPALECIVVDGGSTDGTLPLLKQYGDKIRWLSEPDRGSFDAINRGWQLSAGEILTWLNADDLWEPGAVSTAVEVFERHPEVDVVFGTAGIVDEQGRFHGDMIPGGWDLEHALRHCLHLIFQPASFMRRPILEKVGWLYPAWCHDHDLWLRISLAGGRFHQVPVRLAMDRSRPETLGRVAELVIPAKIELTRRFFATPGLPSHLQQLRRRAISAAYVRSIDYLQIKRPRDWIPAIRLMVQAAVADPLNLGSIGERASRPFRARFGPPLRRLLAPVATFLRPVGRVCRWLLQVVAALLAAPQPWLGRQLELVFNRGNRELTLKIDSLQRRVAAAEQTAAAAVDPLGEQVQRVAADVSRLTRDLESLDPLGEQVQRVGADVSRLTRGLESLGRQHDRLQRQLVEADQVARAAVGPLGGQVQQVAAAVSRLTGALESLDRQHVALRKRLEEAWDHLPAMPSALREVYGTPPTLHPIPGWHTYWGIEGGDDRFLPGRAELWASLKSPVLMRWLADLVVMIWPGNELSRVLFLTGNFEPSELSWMSRTLGEGMTMIDVGAHMGMYSMIAAKLVGPSGIVLAMEPSAREFQRLAFHVTLNELANVRCLPVAASAFPGHATLKIAGEWNSGHNTIGDFSSDAVEIAREERVPTQTVDAVVAAQGLTRVDLIKIDVEGHELHVLTGAAETVARFRPAVLIEVFEAALRNQGITVAALLDFFARHRYALHEFSDVDGELVPLSRPPGSQSRNLVALPT